MQNLNLFCYMCLAFVDYAPNEGYGCDCFVVLPVDDGDGGLMPEYEPARWLTWDRETCGIIECDQSKCQSNIADLSRHFWHCSECNEHLTSLMLCPKCGIRYEPEVGR